MHKIAQVPCKSCPYRRDVPSGVWHESEYDKLPTYDGDVPDQLVKGGLARFDCHQKDGCLCAGWVGTHGAHNLLALRLIADKVDPAVWTYESPVPLFASGQEATDHGKRDLKMPGSKALQVIDRLQRQHGLVGYSSMPEKAEPISGKFVDHSGFKEPN